ncbi:MAG: tetratricopeptide repeat protein [Deltaproteobacteria bacterium]|nr:tetratricopeptide repeat protein [Deltaproteobacteria bacterium]
MSEGDDPKIPEIEEEADPKEALPTEPIVIEIDRQLERLDQVLEKVRGEVTYWAKKGVYTKVRFKFRGKPLLPDLPMAAFLAAEAATFWYTGLLRALVMNVGGRALFDVELISDAEPHLARGQEHLLDGDVDEALEEFQRALAIDRDLPSAHLQVGVCKKLRGEKEGAREAFRKARDLDPHGEVGRQAIAQLKKLG